MEPIEAIQALFTPKGRADPYPYYAVLVEKAPVFPAGEGAVLSGYDACARALRDPRLLMEDGAYLDATSPTDWRSSAALVALDASMLMRNPPDHERVRRLVSREFTARRVATMRPAVTALVDSLLDRLAELGAEGSPVDFMAEFAFTLPVTVISDVLGVPASDRALFRRLAADLTITLEPLGSLEKLGPADAAAEQARAYFADLVAERRQRPTDDLIGALLRVRDSDGARLDEDELIANLILIMVAGFETTTSLLGNGLHLLLSNPEQAARLRDDPALAPGFVEEILRIDPPVHLTSRWTATDTVVDGVTVPAGQQILLLLAAANRDPRRFADPARFDPNRADNQPLSFGAGPHFCLGAPLARMEAQLALPALLRRFPRLALAGPPVRRDRITLRGYDELLVSV